MLGRSGIFGREAVVLVSLIFSLAPFEAIAIDRVSKDSLNEMIESNAQEETSLRDRFDSRQPSSRFAPRSAEFEGETVGARPEGTARNPFRYNPFVREDDVLVRGAREIFEEGPSQGESADLRRVGTR